MENDGRSPAADAAVMSSEASSQGVRRCVLRLGEAVIYGGPVGHGNRAWRRVGPAAELRWAAARGGREARARAARAWRRWLRSAAADTGKCGRVFVVKTILSDPLKQDCGFISK